MSPNELSPLLVKQGRKGSEVQNLESGIEEPEQAMMFVPPVQLGSLPPKQALKYVAICGTASTVNAPDLGAVEPKRFSSPAILGSGVVVGVASSTVGVRVAVGLGVAVGAGGGLSLPPQPITRAAAKAQATPRSVSPRIR